jgi:hypothetical protein
MTPDFSLPTDEDIAAMRKDVWRLAERVGVPAHSGQGLRMRHAISIDVGDGLWISLTEVLHALLDRVGAK